MSEDEKMEGKVLTAVKYLNQPADPPGELERLYLENSNRVFRAAYRVTGNAVDAEDVLQTVFLRLAARDKEVDLSPNPTSYLCRAAVNASLDILRSRKRVTTTSIDDAGYTHELRSTESSPEAEQSSRELQERIRRAIAALSPKSREIAALKYFEGYTNGEISELLGTSQVMVAVILHRVRNRLRNEIGSFLEGHHEAH